MCISRSGAVCANTGQRSKSCGSIRIWRDMMNKIKIMEAAVLKWDAIIAGQRADNGVLDCPPCRIFYILRCFGCPIAEYTGNKFCVGSPYPQWYWHQIEAHDKLRRKVYCPQCIEYATQMRDCMADIVKHLKMKKLSARHSLSKNL